MGWIFRAIFAFAIAMYVLHPQEVARWLKERIVNRIEVNSTSTGTKSKHND
jgi:hypothetical protein